MVKELKSGLLIPDLLVLAKNIKDMPLEVLLDRLIKAVDSERGKVFIDEGPEEIDGFIFATIENFDGEDAVFIQAASVRPGTNNAHELLNRVKLWGREIGLTKAYCLTPRNPAPFIRKFGFKFYSNALKLDL